MPPLHVAVPDRASGPADNDWLVCVGSPHEAVQIVLHRHLPQAQALKWMDAARPDETQREIKALTRLQACLYT